MVNPANVIWCEKYRPKKVSDMVGDFREKILKYIQNPQAIPHFLLYSKTPGTGKSSLQKAIVNELGCDYLLINSSDDRKIETVREKIKEFSMTKSSKQGMRRAVLLDEADGLTLPAQEALRNTMETYASNVFFVLTCNRIQKIIEPIKSRCVLISFAYPNKEEIVKYLIKICNHENMKYALEGLNKVIDMNYPSIRNCVLVLQDLYTEGIPVIPENIRPVNEVFVELWQKLKEKDWQYIKVAVMSSVLDPRELNTYFWENALKDNDIKLLQLCCRNERDIALGSDSKIIFVSSLVEMCK